MMDKKREDTMLARLQSVAMLVLDVDGTLTNGALYMGERGECIKQFSTQDGMAIRALQEMGCRVGIISHSRQREAILARATLLNITDCSVGESANKEDVVQRWSTALSIPLSKMAAMGDNLNDAGMFSVCGLTICPADAAFSIRAQADIVLTSGGGDGCVGEFLTHYYYPAWHWDTLGTKHDVPRFLG